MTSSDSTLERLSDDVIAAASSQRGADCPDELRDALNVIGGHESHGDLRLMIASRLGEVTNASGTGLLAVWLGAGVERGDDPLQTGEAILNSLLHWAGSVETLPDEGVDDDEPELDSELVAGLEMLGQGLVAHLSRSPEMLQRISTDNDVVTELERVQHASAGPTWVLELLQKRSGTLVVIHVEERRGFHVSYQSLSNCFHLFTLLQAALADVKMPGSKRVSSKTLAAARGETMTECQDESWWHYGIGNCPSADLGGSIWGEANPDSIPEIDGQQVVLLWPMIMSSRGWGAGFFRPFLQASPPAVTVTSELTDGEMEQWCLKLSLPAATPPPWWKFW